MTAVTSLILYPLTIAYLNRLDVFSRQTVFLVGLLFPRRMIPHTHPAVSLVTRIQHRSPFSAWLIAWTSSLFVGVC